MTYFFLQFCFKGKLVVKDFYETLLSQKFILILFVFFSFNSYSQCSADAGPDTTKCAEQNVSIGGLIAGTGNGALIYSWSPAVGLSCADCPNPISSATVNTTYTLTVTDSVGCVSIDQVEVIIAADPNATFSFSPTGACSNFPVLFSPGSPAGIQSYQWSFGDPTSGGLNASSQQSPIHIFETFGNGSTTYSVQLIATNAAGCKDTVIQNITVLQTPGAELIDPTNNFQNCTGSNFNMTVYNATVGSASQYTIIWGDGTANYSSSTFPSGGLTHLYNTADIFDLSYIVNGTNGCSDTANYVVANITNPSIGIANPGGTIGCGPTTICFPLSSYSSNHISTIYVVNFGDGSSPVTYTHPPPSEVCHTYSTTSCGQPGNAFTLVIKASNFCDSSFSSVNPIKVYNGPTANFTVPTNRCVNTSVLFTNTSILGYNSTCSRFTTFTWNFGDGTPLLTVNQAILTNPSHTYTLPGTYTVTLTTSNPCSTTTHTAIVCIEVPPVPNFTLTNSINCVPFVPTISNTSTSLNTCSVANTWSVIFNGSTCLPSTGSWNFSGGTTASSTQPQIQFVSPGTYTVRLTMVNSCGTYFVNQNTTGQAAPKITLNPLASICAGTSTSPTATVNSCYESVDVYNWTLTGGTPSSSSLAVPGPVVYPTAGSYTVLLQATNGCGTTSASTPLTVTAPPIANAGNNVQFCSGGNSPIGSASTAGVTYSWSPSTGLSSGTAANPTLTLTNLTGSPIINSYIVTATTTPGCFSKDTVLVTVNPNPVLTVNSPTICFGETASLLVDGAEVGGTYNWNSSPSLSCLNCPNPTASPSATTTYTVIGTNTYGCTTTITSTVTVNALPTTNAGLDNTICLGSSATLTAIGASTYTWSPSTYLNTTSGNSVISTPLTTIQYVVTGTAVNGCTKNDTVNVIVQEPAFVDANSDQVVCALGAVTLNGSIGGSATTSTWTASSGTFSNATSLTSTYTPSITSGNVTLTLTTNDPSGPCLAANDQVIITVNPQPTIISNNASICVGENAILTATGAGVGGSYNWTASPTLNCTACESAVATPVNTTTYTISGTNSLGCSNTSTALVTVNPIPVVSAGADVTLCDQPITYTFVGSPSGGIWSGSPNITNAGVFTPNGGETSNLQYLYTNPLTGCQNSDTVAVTVTPAAIPTAIPTYSICVNNAAVNLNTVLSSTPAGGTWSGTGVTNPTFTPSAAGVGTHTVTYSIGAGTCLATVTSAITVDPQPTISSNNATICVGQSANLTATGAGAGGVYNWMASPTLSCTACQSAIATPITTTSYSVSGTSSLGCTNTTNATVTVNPLPIVSAGADVSLCDQPITYTFVGTPAGGIWSGSPNITSSGVFTPNGTETSNLQYLYTNPSTGCQNTDVTEVTVNPPIIPTAIPTYSICVNNAAVNLNTVLSSTPAGGTWSGTGVTNPTFTPSIAGVGIYSVTYSIGAGTCLATVTSAITVNPQPTISANNATICVGQSAALNATGAGVGGTYNWTASPTLSCTACQSAIATPITTTSYSVSGTSSLGCTNTTNATVTVNPLPIVNAGNDTTLCDQPIPVQMTGTIAGGSWSGPSISPTGLFTPAGTGTYSITYTVVLGTGCTNFDVKIITVISPTLSNAGNDQTVCVGNPSIAITGLPAGGSWSGPGISPAGVFTPSSSGVFGLIYTLGVGNCLTRDTMNFTVNALPIVSAGPDQSFCLSDNSLNFIGNPSGGTWSGTGITNNVSGTFDPVIAGVGVHTIIYTYSDPLTSCLNRDTLLSTVHPLPSVSFNYNTIICQGVAETFTNTSTFVAASQWDFGDGVTASSFSGTHTYSAPGFYDIQLIVTSPFGCVDSLTQSVEVRSAPFADFSIAIDSACGTLVTTFNNISSGSGLSYNWQMGNGQTSSSFNPGAQSYSAALGIDTTYYVQLTVTNNCGASSYLDSIIVMPQPIALFGTNVNSGCSPLLLSMANLSSGLPDSYFWDFGNGSTSTSSANLIQETFVTGNTSSTYTISLVVQNECGVDSTSNSITVFPNTVTAFFNSSVTTGCENLTVNFTQFSIGGTFYNWDFGDNNTSTQLNPTHTFMNPGTYDVTLFVNDGCAFDTMVTSIVVNPAPQVNFSVAPDSVCINEPFTFTNLSSNLANSFWTFGDGGTSGLTDPQYAYSQPGNYSVTLVGASLTNGCVDSVIQIVQVSQNSISSFTANALSGCVPFNVQFTNSSSNAAYQSWNFGDGNSSTAISPGHIFTVPGTYEVQLITESISGCSDTSIVSITVHPVPVSNFTFVSSNTCYTPVVVTMTNTSTGAINYSWDFGNGQTSSNTNTSVTYTNPGTYTISLVAENQYGCQAEYNETITVYPTPVAQFQLPASVACANDVLFFESESLFADSVNWIMGDGSILSGTPVNYAYTDPGNYFITLIAFGAGGCGDTLVSNFSITINPDPVANFEYVNVQIPDPLNGTVEFTNLSQGATNYMWFFANDTTSNETNPIHQFYNYGTYNTTLVAINEFGCTDTIAMDIVVDFFNGLFLPNAIYPGSGIFEISHFVPKGVGLKEYELLIYDDWGNLIWQTTALDINGRPSEFWDGTFNGVPVQQDAYVWKVRAVFLDNAIWEGNDMKTNKIKRSGTVTVIR